MYVCMYVSLYHCIIVSLYALENNIDMGFLLAGNRKNKKQIKSSLLPPSPYDDLLEFETFISSHTHSNYPSYQRCSDITFSITQSVEFIYVPLVKVNSYHKMYKYNRWCVISSASHQVAYCMPYFQSYTFQLSFLSKMQ